MISYILQLHNICFYCKRNKNDKIYYLHDKGITCNIPYVIHLHIVYNKLISSYIIRLYLFKYFKNKNIFKIFNDLLWLIHPVLIRPASYLSCYSCLYLSLHSQINNI